MLFLISTTYNIELCFIVYFLFLIEDIDVDRTQYCKSLCLITVKQGVVG